jgi:hypothetical protein
MTIALTRAGLKTLQEGITGIHKAYAQLPRGLLNEMDLPLFMNFVRIGKYDEIPEGSDTIEVARTYLMWLMVKPVASGEEGEGEALVEPWIDIVGPYFYARPSLGGVLFIKTSRIIADSGPKKMIWPGTPTDPKGIFWGVEFELQVIEVFNRIYANDE